MLELDCPQDVFSLLKGRIKIQVLNKNPLQEEIVGYYSNGQIHFKNHSGEKGFEGNCFAWHDNGVLCEESPYWEGKLEGVLKKWHKNGMLSYEGLYQDGLQEGVHREFYDTGMIKAEKVYKRGLLEGITQEWHPNGQLEGESYYIKNKKDGECKGWFSNGQQSCLESYQVGVKHGIFKEWWQNGQPRSSGQFVLGVSEGIHESWDETGYILSKISYLRGLPHGRCGMRTNKGVWIQNCFIRGVIVPDEIYKLISNKQLSIEHILKIRNTTVRRVCLEEFGYGRLLTQMKYKIINKEGEQELVKISWRKGEEPIYLVKVKCPSTEAFYTLRVPPTMETLKEAIAWTFGLKQNEYNPEKET